MPGDSDTLSCGGVQVARLPLAERFWKSLDRTGDCWLWTLNTRHHDKYCMHEKDPANCRKILRVVTVDRFAWELHFGPLRYGQTIVHLCGDERCMRPEHLSADAHPGPEPSYPGGRSLTDEEIVGMRRLKEKGLSLAALAEAFGVSVRTVSDVTRGCKGPPFGRRAAQLTLEEAFQVRQLLQSGAPRHEIARRFGVSSSYLSRHFPGLGKKESDHDA